MVFLAAHGTEVFADRGRLKAILGAYAGYRADGPHQARFAATTWNRHMSVLSSFYQWAVAEGHAGAVPFSYAQALVRYGDVVREAHVNLARRRTPKRHVTIKYLEADFAELFLRALAGARSGRGTGWRLPGAGVGPQHRDRRVGAGERAAPPGIQLSAGL
jgi:hypothetical protein